MLRTSIYSLALAVLLTGLGLTGADAKHHRKHHHHHKVVAAKGCAASMAMRDESRFWACHPYK